jgi:ABC-type proline/glycine betaine transport system permease subunit
MTHPPFPLVSSGRRPGAGPGRQPGQPPVARRGYAGLMLAGLAAILIVSPAMVAVLSMVFAGGIGQPSVQPIIPFHLVAILESGRFLLALALAPSVMRATELE